MSDQYSPNSASDTVAEHTDFIEPNELELIAIDDHYFESPAVPQPGPQPVMVLPHRLAIAAVVVASIPACLVGFLAYQFTTNNHSTTRETQQLRAAVIADRLNRFVVSQYEGTKLLSLILAKQIKPQISPTQQQLIRDRLNSHKQNSRVLDDITIFDPKGNVLVQSDHGSSQPLDQALFQKAIAVNAPMISKPTSVNSAGYMLSFLVPITDLRTKRINAVLRSQLPLGALPIILQDLSKDLNQDYLITDANGNHLLSSNTFPNLSSEAWQQLKSGVDLDPKPQILAITSTPTLASLPNLNWDVILATNPRAQNFPWLVIGICIVLSTLAIAIVTHILAQQLSRDLIKAVKAINQISEGNFEKKLVVYGDDEISQIGSSINVMTTNFQILLEKPQKTTDQLQRLISKGVIALQNILHTNGEDTNSVDLEAIAAHIQASLVKKQTEVNLEKREKERLQVQLTQKEAEVTASQAKLTKTSTEIEQLVALLKDTITDLQTKLQMAEFDSTPEVLIQNEKVNLSTDLTVQEVLHLRETIAVTSKKVKRLGESSQKVSKMVSVISDIAIQANFLAVNASIKGLRPEDAHDGFAIVIAEVNKLANQSAMVCMDMEQLATNMQIETSEVMAAIEIGTTQVAETTQLVTNIKQNLKQISEVPQHTTLEPWLEPTWQAVANLQKFVQQLKTP